MKTTPFKLACLLLFMTLHLATAQNLELTKENFEARFVDYKPHQQQNVSDKDFSFASMIIDETKKAVKGDPKGFNVADYWNICTAFYTLKESNSLLKMVFHKMLHSEGSCEYLSSLKDKTRLDEIFPKEYQARLDQCDQLPTPAPIDLSAYAKENNLVESLVRKMNQIAQNDGKYRKENYLANQKKQQALDLQNQRIIEELYQTHQTYIGKSLVGQKFESVMWSVIQHSNLKMMKKYLPIIQQAVKEKELALAPLKMLIDRIHAIEDNYQVFGSQQGVEIAPKVILEQLKKKYEID